MIKGYKVFNSDWTCSPNGNIKQYTCPGKFEEDIIPIRCGIGIHFCKVAADCFTYYSFNPCNKVAEIIAYGDIAEEGDKCCTNKIEIVREIPWMELLTIVNTGNGNTGYRNTGNRNTGNGNTGDRNRGNRNTGDCNTGDRNTGDWNTGNRNTGDSNTGDRNTGNMNTGNRNTGNRNTGDSNTGDWNTGNMNTGDWNTGNRNTGNGNTGYRNTGNRNTGYRNTGNMNTGNRNTGDWNTTNYSSGVFCTELQKAIIFDKPSDLSLDDWWKSDANYLLNQIKTVFWVYSDDMTDQEKELHPEHETTGGFLKTVHVVEAAIKWWNNLSDKDKQIIKDIPNFDAEKFYKITGIKV